MNKMNEGMKGRLPVLINRKNQLGQNKKKRRCMRKNILKT